MRSILLGLAAIALSPFATPRYATAITTASPSSSTSTSSTTQSSGALAVAHLGAPPSPTLSQVFYSANFEAGMYFRPWQNASMTPTSSYSLSGAGMGSYFSYNNSAPCTPTRLVLTDLPPHTSLDVGFLLALVGTWDGIGGSPGPDRFNVSVDGALIFSHVFGLGSGSTDYTPSSPPLISQGRLLLYSMASEPSLRNIPHTSPTVTVEWYANGPGWQGGDDESWGIDNVTLTLNGVPAPPAISGIAPSQGFAGDSVVVTGAFFPTATSLSFNGLPATIVRLTDSSTTAIVPAGATTGPITVGNALGSTTSSQVFVVHQIPAISSVSPSEGSLGAVVTIRGSHLDEIASLGFGNTYSAALVLVSPSEIRAYVGEGSTSGAVLAQPLLGPTVVGPAFTVLAFDARPRIQAIYDVPRDQGGRVSVTWKPSDYDRLYFGSLSNFNVSAYRVWRRAMPPAGPKAADISAAAEGFDGSGATGSMWRANSATGVSEYWEAIGTVPAAFLDGYAYTAETTQDSIPGGAQFTAFMVQTVPRLNTSTSFFFSEVDSGYSVDNLPPRAPLFAGARYEAGQNHLHWLPNTEADLNGYILYRGTHPDFVIDVTDPVAFVADTGYVDAAAGPMYYKIAAVDRHGNRSPYITVLPTGNAGVGGGGLSLAFSLARPFPNPSDGSSLNVEFTLPTAAPATLEVLDVSGRCVLRDDLAGYAAGRHTIDIAKRVRLASGLYVIRVTQSGTKRTIRATVLK